MKTTNKLAFYGGDPVRNKPYKCFINPRQLTPEFDEEDIVRVKGILDSGNLSGFIANASDSFYGGPHVIELEKLFENYFEAEHAISVNSCTSGLHAAIASLKLEEGAEVIVPSLTVSMSAAAIKAAGAVPTLADVDVETHCLSGASIERAITSRTKAVMVVHLFGRAANMDEILQVCKKHKLHLIEDCAQAPGAIYNNQKVGTFGDIGVFSFNQNKVITCGEGGMIITNNDRFAKRCELIRNHGEAMTQEFSDADFSEVVGFNYRMNEIEAYLSSSQFKKLDRLNSKRIELANYLINQLSEINFIKTPNVIDQFSNVVFQLPILLNCENLKSAQLCKALGAEGIPFSPCIKPLYELPMFNHYKEEDFPNTRLLKSCLVLTKICHNNNVDLSDIDHAVQALHKISKNLNNTRKIPV